MGAADERSSTLIQGRTREMIEWAEKGLPLLKRFGLQDEVLKMRPIECRSRVAHRAGDDVTR